MRGGGKSKYSHSSGLTAHLRGQFEAWAKMMEGSKIV